MSKFQKLKESTVRVYRSVVGISNTNSLYSKALYNILAAAIILFVFALGFGIVLGIYWIMWKLWVFGMSGMFPMLPDSVKSPEYLNFMAVIFVLLWVRSILFKKKED